MVGVGRGTYEKTYDSFLKFSILRQSKGKKNMPVSLSFMSDFSLNTLPADPSQKIYFWDRASFVTNY